MNRWAARAAAAAAIVLTAGISGNALAQEIYGNAGGNGNGNGGNGEATWDEPITFGDFNDPASTVSRLASERASFQMHAELGTDPVLRELCGRSLSLAVLPGRSESVVAHARLVLPVQLATISVGEVPTRPTGAKSATGS